MYCKNKDIIRRYYEDLWNPWGLDAAHESIAPDMEFRGSLGVTVRAIVGFQSYMSTVRAAFPDFHNQIEDLQMEDLVAEGDQVVVRLTCAGTHLGEMFGLAPMGKAISYGGTAVFRISGDRVVDGWVTGDRWGRLGAIQTNQRPGRSQHLRLTSCSAMGAK